MTSILGRSLSSAGRTRDSKMPDRSTFELGQNATLPEHVSAMYRRYYSTDSSNHSQACTHTSFASSRKSSPTVVETLLSRIVDALIFTSAVAITAYHYWRGNLNSDSSASIAPIAPPRQATLNIKQLRQTHLPRHTELSEKLHDHMQDARRQRTQEWAETVVVQQDEQHKAKRTSFNLQTKPTSASSSSDRSTLKRRAKSLPPPPRVTDSVEETQKKEDAMLARMEERLQSLIEEGQAALKSKPQLYDMDDSEVAMRMAFSGNRYTL